VVGDLGDGLGVADRLESPSIDQMPIVRLGLADSAAAASLLASARRGRIPIPGLELGHEWRDPTLPGQSFWLFGLTIPIPLLNQNGARVAVTGARAEQAAAAVKEARLDAAQQLAEARARLDEAAARALRARDSLIPAAQQLRGRAVLAYQLGETGLLAVLEALRTEREAESAGLEDLLAFQEAKATWYSLLGVAR
jgi:outer membrane protein TolC